MRIILKSKKKLLKQMCDLHYKIFKYKKQYKKNFNTKNNANNKLTKNQHQLEEEDEEDY